MTEAPPSRIFIPFRSDRVRLSVTSLIPGIWRSPVLPLARLRVPREQATDASCSYDWCYATINAFTRVKILVTPGSTFNIESGLFIGTGGNDGVVDTSSFQALTFAAGAQPVIQFGALGTAYAFAGNEAHVEIKITIPNGQPDSVFVLEPYGTLVCADPR